jgi:hypothetical protein
MPLEGLRECRATSLDQTPIGKWSRAGRLTRNGPKLSNHDCACMCVNAAPRRDIRRGPSFSTAPWGSFREFTAGGLSVSSGMDPATRVPAPTKLSKYPSASNCSYAFKTGMREIFRSAARALVDGTRCPGCIFPSMMAFRNQSYNCLYIGDLVRELSEISGRNVAGIRFIRNRAKWLHHITKKWSL